MPGLYVPVHQWKGLLVLGEAKGLLSLTPYLPAPRPQLESSSYLLLFMILPAEASLHPTPPLPWEGAAWAPQGMEIHTCNPRTLNNGNVSEG